MCELSSKIPVVEAVIDTESAVSAPPRRNLKDEAAETVLVLTFIKRPDAVSARRVLTCESASVVLVKAACPPSGA